MTLKRLLQGLPALAILVWSALATPAWSQEGGGALYDASNLSLDPQKPVAAATSQAAPLPAPVSAPAPQSRNGVPLQYRQTSPLPWAATAQLAQADSTGQNTGAGEGTPGPAAAATATGNGPAPAPQAPRQEADPAATPGASPADSSLKPVQWAAQGEQTCLKCHDTVTDRTVMSTAHGVKGDPASPMAQHACESCHGPSPEHNNAKVPKGQKRPPTDVVFKGEFTSPVDKRNELCASCHMGEEHINWQGSQHQASDVACTDCHVSHTLDDPALNKKKQPEVCFTCHTQQRAESFQYSHHPIREGKVACSDCHNSHGSGSATAMLKEMTLNETCYTCHAEQRGPFMWEHEPVREDCSTCHTPHGATQANLLKQREPFLCMECHQTSRNNHEAMVSGANQLPGGGGVSNYNMLLSRGCENCHSKVHGSNSPAGQMLTR